jgi:thioredoxin-like negative regulator of GroEL
MSRLRLDSWKSIADYLERSPRTVQRWHTTHGLPVHHFGGCKGSVFAYSHEIDRWLTSLGEESRGSDSDGDAAHETRKRRSDELTARATEMWETHSEENLNTIAGIYRKAIDQHPGNARALIGLADTMISASLEGEMDGSVAYPCAAEALRRASQLDPHDLDGRCGQAWLNLVYGRKWRQARAGFEDVLSEQPRMSFALAGQALLHIAEGDLTSASRCAWEAWMQNTLVSTSGILVCWSKYLQGDFERALELVSQVRGSGGCGATIGAIEALALIQAGSTKTSTDRIEAIAAEFPRSQPLQGALGHAYATTKQIGKALDVLQNLEHPSTQKKPNNPYGRALVLIGLGDVRQAAPWLETAYAEGSLWSLGFGSDPVLRRLSGDPSFDLLLQKIGPPGFKLIQSLHSLDFMVRSAPGAVERKSNRSLTRA